MEQKPTHSLSGSKDSSKTSSKMNATEETVAHARSMLESHLKQVEMEIDSDILSAYENEALSIMLSPKSQKSSKDKSPDKLNKSPKGLRKSQLTPSKQETTIRITRSISSSQGKGKNDSSPKSGSRSATKRALSPSRDSEIIELRGNKIDVSEIPEENVPLYSAARLWIRDNREYDSDDETLPFELQLPPPEPFDPKSKQKSESNKFQADVFEKAIFEPQEIPHTELLQKLVANSRAARESYRKQYHQKLQRFTKRLKKVFDSNTNQMTPADEMLTRYIVNVRQNTTNNGV